MWVCLQVNPAIEDAEAEGKPTNGEHLPAKDDKLAV